MSKDNMFWNENSNEVPIEDLSVNKTTEPVENTQSQQEQPIGEQIATDQSDSECAAACEVTASDVAEAECAGASAAAAAPDLSESLDGEAVNGDEIESPAPEGNEPQYAQTNELYNNVTAPYQGMQYAGAPYAGVADNALDESFYDKKAARKRFTAIGFGFAIFTVVTYGVCLLLQFVALFVEELYGIPVLDSNLFLNAVTPVSMYLFALPIVIAFFAICRVKGERPPEKKKMPLSMWVVVIVCCFGLMYIGAYIGQYVMSVLSSYLEYDFNSALESVVSYDDLWVSVIFVCIVAPIGEEFVFRKLLIDRTHKYGAVVSVVLSALMFGLMHANFYQFFYAFFIGLVLGYIYYSTGKVWYTIIIHAIVNFVGSIVTTILSVEGEKMLEALENVNDGSASQFADFMVRYGWIYIAETAFTLFVFAAMICAVVVPIVMRKKMFPKREGALIPKGKSFAAAFASAGVIVMLVVYVVEFAQYIVLPILVNYLNSLAQVPA